MSDSRRKTPIVSNGGFSEKKDKQQYNRGYRRLIRALIDKGWFDSLPKRPMHRHGGNWNFNKDGKHWTDEERCLRK